MNQLTNQSLHQGVSAQVEKFIDTLFDQLCASCPQLLNLTLERLQVVKRQWILGFAENGITKITQVKRGMAEMRAKPNGYLPSVGEFIQACKVLDYHVLGLPNEAELYQRYKTFLGYARFNRDEFQYRSKVEFWLLKNLYEKCKKKSEEDTLKAIPKLLTKAAEKVRSNFPFEDIPKMIPEKPRFYDKAKADKARDSLMAMMKGKGALQ
ncbi:replication protein P [Haemophilus influenzae]